MAARLPTLLSTHQPTFGAFYIVYAPKLWGLIQLAHLTSAQSEAILINTLTTSWQQLDQPTQLIKPTLTWLLTIAYGEGLPIKGLRDNLFLKM